MELLIITLAFSVVAVVAQPGDLLGRSPVKTALTRA